MNSNGFKSSKSFYFFQTVAIPSDYTVAVEMLKTDLYFPLSFTSFQNFPLHHKNALENEIRERIIVNKGESEELGQSLVMPCSLTEVFHPRFCLLKYFCLQIFSIFRAFGFVF